MTAFADVIWPLGAASGWAWVVCALAIAWKRKRQLGGLPTTMAIFGCALWCASAVLAVVDALK